MTPASILKIYTCASAMNLLPENFRFQTKVYLSGRKGLNGEWNGNLIVKASGDPTLESEHFSGYGGFIQRIIDSLIEKGICRLNGDIILENVDASHQYPEGPLDTWCINDVTSVYGCGAFDFNWCDNYFGLYPATGRKTSPVPLDYEIWDRPWSQGLDMIRGIYSEYLIISGKKYSTDSKAKINTSMPYPFDVFKNRMTDRLEGEGISVTGEESDESGRTLLITHTSPPLDDILKSLMHRSDNMYAEAILRKLGDQYGDRNTSIKAENRLWESKGIASRYNRILDGSGLSRANAVSPKMFGEVLEWMIESDMARRFINLFPVAGVSGTMKSFMTDSPLKRRLAFKTGSLNSVMCYAGYVTDSDGMPTHVAVIMVNNFFCARADVKKAIQNFLLEQLLP